MVWGSSQIHRQYFKNHFVSRKFRLPLAIVYPALFIHLRWQTIRRNSTAVERSATRNPKENHDMRPKKKELAGDQDILRDVGWARLPREHLLAIDRIFSRRMNKDDVFSFLQGFPASAILYHRLQDRDHARKLAEYLAGSRSPHRALWTLVIANNFGVVFKQNAYECVVHRLVTGGHWDLALSVIKLGKRHTGRTTVRLLNWRTRALIETSQFQLLERMFNEFDSEGLQPNRRTFHLLVSGHIRNRNLSKAREYLSKMEEAGFPIDASTHALIVSVYRSLGPDVAVQQKAFDSLGEVGDRDATIVLNSLIQFALDADDVNSALGYLSLFNVPADVIVRSENSGVRDDDSSAPIQRIIRPDPTTFTMLINHASKKHDLQRLFSIIGKMESCDVQPDSVLIASLIPALCNENDINSAVSIVACLCDSNVTPGALLCRLGLDPETPSSIPPILSLSNVKPDVQIFNALMKGVSTTLGINGMRVVLRLMRANGVFPDMATLDILATYLNTNENPQPRTLIRTIRSLLSRSMRPSLRLVHAIMKAIIRQQSIWSRTGTVSGVVDEVAESRQQPRPSEPLAGIYIPKKLSYRSMTRPIRRSLKVRGVRSDRVTVSLLMKQAALQRNIEGVEGAFRTMLGRGMHANVFHYAGLMHAHADAGDVAMAESVFQTALRAGVKPNATMFTILIVGHGRQGNPSTAMRVFEDMVAQGIKPDKPAIHAVAAAYYVSGLHGTARRVLLDLWPSVAPLPEELRGASARDIFKAFHALRANGQRKCGPPLSNRRQRILRWKLRRLIEVWTSL